MKLTDKEFTVVTSKQELISFLNYCTHCEMSIHWKNFSNDFYVELIKYSLKTLMEKLFKHSFNVMNKLADHKVKFKINQAERVVMSIVFKIVPVPVQACNIEFQIINRLHLSK